MRILALDAGDDAAIIGAVELSGRTASLLGFAAITEPRALARDLIGALDGVLTQAGWVPGELDLIATGLGPGSWTSLRVAITTAKTLAQAQQVPLLGVPSFDALAAAAHEVRLAALSSGRRAKKKEREIPASLLLVVTPCRPGELYGKLFLSHPDYLGVAQSEWIAAPQRHLDASFSQMLASEVHGPLLLAGSAAHEAAALLAARGDEYELLETPLEQRVLTLAMAGVARMQEGELDDPLTLTPLYLGVSNAERNLAAGLLKLP